jgi:hypothetical protein
MLATFPPSRERRCRRDEDHWIISQNGNLDVRSLPCGLVHVLYCGDHDAAGWNMDGNIVQRLKDHGSADIATLIEHDVIQFKRIALTLDQVVEYDLDPDPKRATGDLAKAYREHFEEHPLVKGDRQWSFEALPPDVALRSIRGEVDALLDVAVWNRGAALETVVQAKLAEGRPLIG